MAHHVAPMELARDVRAFIVVRESDIAAWISFSTMVRQIVDPLTRLPGVSTFLGLCKDDASAIMRDDEEGRRLRILWNARTLEKDGKPYGVEFVVEGTVFFFAVTSANAVEDMELANAFVDDLVASLWVHRPTDLFTGPETRLVRREYLGHRLGETLKALGQPLGTGITVHTKTYPEGIKAGTFQYTILCRQAEDDLKAILSRFLAGRVYAVRRNAWERGCGGMLLGWSVDDEDAIVLGSDAVQEQARIALRMAAQAWDLIESGTDAADRISAESIVGAMSAAGATKRGGRKTGRSGRPQKEEPLDTVANPKRALLTILRDASVYETGVLRRTHQLPMTGMTSSDAHGMTIYRNDPEDPYEKGFTVFEWTLPLPETPFADSATIVKARRYYGHLLETKQAYPEQPQAWPFSSLFTADHHGVHYRLRHMSTGYSWREWDDVTRDMEPVGQFDVLTTTNALIESLITRLEEEGLSPTELGMHVTRTKPLNQDARLTIEGLQRELVAKEGEFSAMISISKKAKTERARQSYADEADALSEEIEELERKIAEASSETVTEELDPPELEVGTLADLLSVTLDTAGQSVDPVVAKAWAKVIVDGRIDDCWDDASPWGTFSYRAKLATSRGTRITDPITFTVGNTAYGKRGKGSAVQRRLRRVLDLRMAEGWELEDLAARLARPNRPRGGGIVTPKALFGDLSRHATELLGCTRQLASALIDHPIAETRAAVWAMAVGTPMPLFEELTPAERDRHLEVLWDAYLDPKASWPTHSAFLGGERHRRETARWVYVNSINDPDAGAPYVGLCKAMCWKKGLSSIHRLTASVTKNGDPQAALLEKWTTTGRSEWGHGSIYVDTPKGRRLVPEVPDEEKRLRIRMCPHCETRTLLQPIPCPEGGSDPALCTECLRTPEDPSHKFPAAYLLLIEGPWGAGTAKRSRGDRGGSRVGEAPAMPTAVRSKRSRRIEPRG